MGILRTFLALAVVTRHSSDTVFGYQPLGGTFAVRLFYVISGLYTALVLDTKYGVSLLGSLVLRVVSPCPESRWRAMLAVINRHPRRCRRLPR
jgi:peptidoglycan/LPS O-acetylase OafA/YrhL